MEGTTGSASRWRRRSGGCSDEETMLARAVYVGVGMTEPAKPREPEGGWRIVSERDKAAIERLARGLSPCEMWFDEYGRELDCSGNLVNPDQPPGPYRLGREAK